MLIEDTLSIIIKYVDRKTYPQFTQVNSVFLDNGRVHNRFKFNKYVDKSIAKFQNDYLSGNIYKYEKKMVMKKILKYCDFDFFKYYVTNYNVHTNEIFFITCEWTLKHIKYFVEKKYKNYWVDDIVLSFINNPIIFDYLIDFICVNKIILGKKYTISLK
jgi:hypothetical protein